MEVLVRAIGSPSVATETAPLFSVSTHPAKLVQYILQSQLRASLVRAVKIHKFPMADPAGLKIMPISLQHQDWSVHSKDFSWIASYNQVLVWVHN
jgi:hypothetical protein